MIVIKTEFLFNIYTVNIPILFVLVCQWVECSLYESSLLVLCM